MNEVLNLLTELTKAQLDAFRSHNEAELMRLDKELELAFGRKERSFGALREHERQHKCALGG